MSLHDNWEPVIGLEIHVELNTKSKLFSVAPNRFGDEPNTNITEVCTGQPGALPVLNKEAVHKAVQFGCSIDATVAPFSKFDRKSYFYPDSPRNFQITQFDQPIVIGGTVVAEVNGEEKSFAVNRAHLEDDAGMLKHFTNFAGVDYNRAGVPLIEIVSEPCIHSADEAVAYAKAIKAILEYIDASDCNMEEGSLRIDANISVRLKGEQGFRNKIEIKNMNSFSNMHTAIEAEVKRQIREYLTHPNKPFNEVIAPSTYRFDVQKGLVLMRSKETAADYRYFPEPDLVPIILDESYIKEVKASLPELPLQRERRYVKELNLSAHNAFVLTSDKPISDYFEEALKHCPNAKSLCTWITVEFAGRLKENGKSLISIGLPAIQVAKLVNLIDKGVITGRMAKDIADKLVEDPTLDCEAIVESNPDFRAVSDTSEIKAIVEKVVSENPQSITDFKAGKDKALAYLVGQVMKHSKGKASPAIVNELLKEFL